MALSKQSALKKAKSDSAVETALLRWFIPSHTDTGLYKLDDMAKITWNYVSSNVPLSGAQAFFARATDNEAGKRVKIRMNRKVKSIWFTKCYLRPGEHFWRLLRDWSIDELLSLLPPSTLACAACVACLAGCAIAGW